MGTTRGRLVYTNQVVYDQADYFQADGYSRVTGIVPAQLILQVYYNNTQMPWSIVSGIGVPEASVASGRVYWQEIPGGPYGIRFRPNAVGYWRVLITWPFGRQIMGQDYDVNAGSGIPETSGLRASFSGGQKNGC